MLVSDFLNSIRRVVGDYASAAWSRYCDQEMDQYHQWLKGQEKEVHPENRKEFYELLKILKNEELEEDEYDEEQYINDCWDALEGCPEDIWY
jgi:ferredoxin